MAKRHALAAELDRDRSGNLLLASPDSLTPSEPTTALTRHAPSKTRHVPHHCHPLFSGCAVRLPHPRARLCGAKKAIRSLIYSNRAESVTRGEREVQAGHQRSRSDRGRAAARDRSSPGRTRSGAFASSSSPEPPPARYSREKRRLLRTISQC